MAKKLIGLTGPSGFTPECVDMLEEFFAADFVLLYHNQTDNLLSWVDRCDGICLAGGVDIHPMTYGQSVANNRGFNKFDLRRDQREIRIIERCQEVKKPLLGICRGHQMLGVKLGFTLIADLAGSSVCHQPAAQQITLQPNEPAHSVEIVSPTEYAKTFLPDQTADEKVSRLWTNSFHHQGLAYPTDTSEMPVGAEAVRIYGTARADLAGVDQIIELMGGEYWVSCQWHPECDWRQNAASQAVLKRFGRILKRG